MATDKSYDCLDDHGNLIVPEHHMRPPARYDDPDFTLEKLADQRRMLKAYQYVNHLAKPEDIVTLMELSGEDCTEKDDAEVMGDLVEMLLMAVRGDPNKARQRLAGFLYRGLKLDEKING